MWPQLQQTVLQGWQVLNAGVDGDNVKELQVRLNKDVLSHAPNLVVIKVGINDSAPYEGKLAVPVDEFIHAYQYIIDKIMKANAQLLLCTPTILGEDVLNPDSEDSNIAYYTEKIKDLAQANNLPLADLRGGFVAARLKNNL